MLVTAAFSSEMNLLWASWIGLIRTVTGAKAVAEYKSPIEAFVTILLLNGLAVLAVSLAGIFLLSPLVLPIYGAFYAAAISRRGLGFPEPRGLALMCLEALFLILAPTFARSFGSEAFGFSSPRLRALLRFWGEILRRTPKPSTGLQDTIRTRRKEIALAILTVASLLVFAAWFEVWAMP